MWSRASALAALVRQPGGLPALSRQPPLPGSVRDLPGLVRAALLAVPAATAGLPGRAACAAPRFRCAPRGACRYGSGRGGGEMIAPGLAPPPASAPCTAVLRRCRPSLSRRPSAWLASRPDRPSATRVPRGLPGLLRPRLQLTGSPRVLAQSTTAPN